MPVIRRSQIEPFTAKQMYALVNDIERYPEFLPWCKQVRILSQYDNCVDVSMEISKGPVNKWFSTHNILTPDQSIEINLIRGPFKKLKGSWMFTELPDQHCRIDFELQFELTFGPFANLLNPVFENIYSSMIRAFTKRARAIY